MKRAWVPLSALADEHGVSRIAVVRRRPAFARVRRRTRDGCVEYERAGAERVMRGIVAEVRATRRRRPGLAGHPRPRATRPRAPEAPPPNVPPLPPCVACESGFELDRRARLAAWIPARGPERVMRFGVACGRAECDGEIAGLGVLARFPVTATESAVLEATAGVPWTAWAADQLREITQRRRPA